MVSPQLNTPLRSEAEAEIDRDHRQHTTSLVGVLYHLASTEAPAHYIGAVEYALDALHEAQAERLVERTRVQESRQ